MEALSSLARDSNTDELLVVHRDKVLLHERYGEEKTSDVYAVQKGVVALLIGVALRRGLLRLEDAVSGHIGTGWTRLPKDQEQRLTIEHLMAMTTGMTDTLQSEGTIGATWRYNNPAYNYLKKLLLLRAGRDIEISSLNELTNDWLEPLGLRETRWVAREEELPDGSPITGLLMSGDDMVRLGAFFLTPGEELLDRSFLDRCVRPGSEANPAWGLLLWNNDHSRVQIPFIDRSFDGRILPEVGKDLIAARGANDQFVSVLPSRKLVLVRRGGTSGIRGGFERSAWKELLANL